MSESILNQAIEAVMDLIDALSLFASITRGALSAENSLSCEIGPSGADEVYLDKNQYIILDLTINGKHSNLQTLSDTMNHIHEVLTMLTIYPSGGGWQIVDIVTATLPQIIGREGNNLWIMASSLTVKVFTDSETIHPVLLPYRGEYNVRSKANEDQNLDTTLKYMNRDMTVEKIYYSETANEKGGDTVYIGE